MVEHRGISDDDGSYHKLQCTEDNATVTHVVQQTPLLQRFPGEPEQIEVFYIMVDL